MKFGTVTQIGRLQGTDRLNFEFFKNQDGGGRHLEKPQKLRYLRNGFTDLYEICMLVQIVQNGSLNHPDR